MNEEEYRVWKGNIVADYRLEGVCIFLGLGLLLHLQAGGPAALAAPRTLLFFAVGFLISYFLVGEINFRIIVTHARLRIRAYKEMPVGDQVNEVSRARRLVRFLQMLVCLLVPWGLNQILAVWKF